MLNWKVWIKLLKLLTFLWKIKYGQSIKTVEARNFICNYTIIFSACCRSKKTKPYWSFLAVAVACLEWEKKIYMKYSIIRISYYSILLSGNRQFFPFPRCGFSMQAVRVLNAKFIFLFTALIYVKHFINCRRTAVGEKTALD